MFLYLNYITDNETLYENIFLKMFLKEFFNANMVCMPFTMASKIHYEGVFITELFQIFVFYQKNGINIL